MAREAAVKPKRKLAVAASDRLGSKKLKKKVKESESSSGEECFGMERVVFSFN